MSYDHLTHVLQLYGPTHLYGGSGPTFVPVVLPVVVVAVVVAEEVVVDGVAATCTSTARPKKMR